MDRNTDWVWGLYHVLEEGSDYWYLFIQDLFSIYFFSVFVDNVDYKVSIQYCEFIATFSKLFVLCFCFVFFVDDLTLGKERDYRSTCRGIHLNRCFQMNPRCETYASVTMTKFISSCRRQGSRIFTVYPWKKVVLIEVWLPLDDNYLSSLNRINLYIIVIQRSF